MLKEYMKEWNKVEYRGGESYDIKAIFGSL